MLIIPIGHEDNTVRRLPWVTFAIIGACFVLHIIFSFQMSGAKKDLEAKLQDFIGYFIAHPYLEPDQESIVRLMGESNAAEFMRGLEMVRSQSDQAPPEDSEEEQARFNELTEELVRSIDAIPARTYGYIPARGNLLGLLTYMFIHSGWLHLLGNLLFLYLTAPFIEDVWGRPLFTAFYLAAGVFAALMFGIHYPHINGPLVGASGAIAGVMGAFAVRYWKTKIEFFYFFFFVRGTFSAPAFIMLPLWFVLELFNAGAMDTLNPGSGGGVAHWAHVWGFAFGLAAALAVKKLRFEERVVSPKIEAAITYLDPVTQSLEDALKMKQDRRFEESYARVLDLAKKNPGREDVVRVLWGMAVEQGNEAEAGPLASAMIEREIRREQLDAAADDYHDFRRSPVRPAMSPAAKITLARHLIKKNETEEARDLAAEALARLEANAPPGLLLMAAEVAWALSPALTKKAIALCLENPEIPSVQKDKMREYLGRLSKPS